MGAPLAPTKELEPVTPLEAEEVYRGHKEKLLRAAYLRVFTPDDVERCRRKFTFFTFWWQTLNERQRERVKGAIAAEAFHVFRHHEKQTT